MSDLILKEAIDNLSDDDVSVRKEAVNALIGVTDIEAIDPLIEATTDDNAQIRFKAAEILGNMGEVARDKLIEKFEASEGKNKRFLTFALKETKDEKVIPYFAGAVEDDDFGVRKTAIRALGELQAHDELYTIAKGLEDEDWGVRLATIYALGDLASDESIDLIKDARRNEKDKDFKKSCNKALKKAEKAKKAKASGETLSKVKPISTIKEMEKTNVQKAIKHTITLDYGEVTDISPDIRLTLHNAGHILGSAISHMHIGDGAHNLVYTGDFKYERSRLLEPATFRFPRAETVIMESTYGGREDIQPSRNSAEKEMMKTIYKTLKRGGKVLVPVFAVGRAQELMVVLEEYMRHGMIDEVPIYIDGMIWEATAIHTARPEYLSKDLRDQIFHMGRNPFISDMFNKVQNLDQRKDIVESNSPAIILSTSGMLTGGNSVEYFKWLCEDDRNTLIFVGYQSEGSLGRRIQKGWKEVPLEEDNKTKVFNVKMEIKTINGFSGHSNRRQLMDYVKRLNPRPDKVITCHGDPYKTTDLASSIHRSYKIETKSPVNLDSVRIH